MRGGATQGMGWALFEELDDEHGQAVLLHRLGIQANLRGDLERARELVESSDRIHARAGSVWVTEEASSRDHILGPGEILVVGRDGRTVIQALKASWIALRDAAPANDPIEGATA